MRRFALHTSYKRVGGAAVVTPLGTKWNIRGEPPHRVAGAKLEPARHSGFAFHIPTTRTHTRVNAMEHVMSRVTRYHYEMAIEVGLRALDAKDAAVHDVCTRVQRAFRLAQRVERDLLRVVEAFADVD